MKTLQAPWSPVIQTAFQGPVPFVKWAGGKSSLLHELLNHVPRQFSDYYEPFLGGGALFFAIYARNTPFKAHLSDVNDELINTYKIIKNTPEALIELLSRFRHKYNNTASPSSYYYDMREWRPSSAVERAARLIFLNKTCYNGLYRVNSRGEFNVPFGRYKRPNILNAQNLREVSIALCGTDASLDTSDYKTSISRCKKGDFVYLDPPYQPKSKSSSFTNYAPGGFSETDHEELAEGFAKLVGRGCLAVLSNSDTDLTRRLFRDFRTIRMKVNRPINSVGTGRTGYEELIVLGVPS